MAQGKRKTPPKPKTPAEAELKPLRIVGKLTGARYNEHGEMVGEEVMGEIEIFRANFGKLDQIVNDAIAEAREAEEA